MRLQELVWACVPTSALWSACLFCLCKDAPVVLAMGRAAAAGQGKVGMFCSFIPSPRVCVCPRRRCGSSAYILNHTLRMEWPCLSFDIIRDGWGMERVRFPLTAAIVTGTQVGSRAGNL